MEENNEKKIITPTDEDVREELPKICNEVKRAIAEAGGCSELKAFPLPRRGSDVCPSLSPAAVARQNL